MKILLLSAYHASSHAYWAEGLKRNFQDYSWTELSLSPRYFAWRVRGNPLSWATRHREVLSQAYDLILATSMVDLACLRGLVPQLSSIPAIVYFHENQFAYPLSEQANSNVEAQMVSLYAALSAQQIIFNSRYNQQSYLQGVTNLLKKFPDEKPADLAELLDTKSSILPVPLDFPLGKALKKCSLIGGATQIVWNHRWEYDKGPERLAALVQNLDPKLSLTFHIVGQRFRSEPTVMQVLKACLHERNWLGAWGYIESREAYIELLAASDFVVSSSLHDFQGLSMLEAIYLGCVPLAPSRLAYTEFIPPEYLYESIVEDADKEARAAADLLQKLIHEQNSDSPATDVSAYTWNAQAKNYRELFESTAVLEV